jgi:tetratricopeptide (TPR) repeat protein
MPAKKAQAPNSAPPTVPGCRIDGRLLLAGVVLAAAAFAAYSRTFSVPALFDDDPSIADNPSIRHFATALWPPSYATVGGRPVLNLSLAVNYGISGTRLWSYHAANLAIHILAGLVLMGIIRRTLVRAAQPAATLIAFSAALIWTLHPLQTESVTYVIQRAESLMGLFYLSALYFLIRGAGAGESGGRMWQVASVCACLLGMATKEVMVSAPLIILLYDRAFLAGSFREAWRRRWGVYIGLAATWLVLPFLVVSTHGRGGTAGFGSGVSAWRYALTEFPAIVRYLRLALWPQPLVFDYGTALATPSPAVFSSALLVLALLGVAIWALARRPKAGFLAVVFFAILAPSSSIVPVASEPVAEHRMYLALIPVVVFAVMGIYRLLGRAAAPACMVVAAVLLGATLRRNEDYRSDEALWRDTVDKLPANERAQNNLGNALDDEGRTGEAISQFETVLALKPDLAEAHSNLGNALSKTPGRLDDAITQYREAVRLKPEYEPAHKNLGVALMDEGRLTESIGQSEEAVRLRPGDAQAHSNLGGALMDVPGRLNDAIAECQLALRLNPELAAAHSNLGNALARIPGHLDEAIAQCEEGARLDPSDAKARNDLGNALVKAPGRVNDAIAQFEDAVRLNPHLLAARNNLGNALDAAGRGGEAIAEFKESLRLNPGSPEAHSNLGNVLAKTPGRMDEAIAEYDEALRLRPDYVSAHNNLGSALNAEGRTAEAVAQYEAAIRLRPDIASIHLSLAVALLRMPGGSAEAAEQLRTALRLQPDNVVARNILNRMGSAGP